MIAASLRALLLALAACGTATHGPAPQAGAGSAARDGSGPPPAPDDVGREAIQDTAQEAKTVPAAATVLASASDSFEYKVGNPHFHGRTVVRVTGDGKAEVSSERGGKIQSYQGAVSPAQLKALRESLTRHPIDGYKPARRNPVPDEATMELTLVTGGNRTEAEILDNERHEIDALGELVDVIQEIASRVSGGKVRY